MTAAGELLLKQSSQDTLQVTLSGVTLAAAVPEKKDARKAPGRVSFLAHVGDETVDFFS